MSDLHDEQINALAVITMMPGRIEVVKATRYARAILNDLEKVGSFEMNSNPVWSGRARNLPGGKKLVKEILVACGVVFTGGDRFTGPLVATLKGKRAYLIMARR